MTTRAIVYVTDGHQARVLLTPMDGNPLAILRDIATTLETFSSILSLATIARAICTINQQHSPPEIAQYFKQKHDIELGLNEVQKTAHAHHDGIRYINHYDWYYEVHLRERVVQVYSSLPPLSNGDRNTTVNPFNYLRLVRDEFEQRISDELLTVCTKVVNTGFLINGEHDPGLLSMQWKEDDSIVTNKYAI